MQTNDTQKPQLTNALIRDLLDPTVSTLDLCDYHGLTLPKLLELINSHEFEHLQACFKEINDKRTKLTTIESRFTAIAQLNKTAQLRPDDTRSAETVRKAAAHLERITRPKQRKPIIRSASSDSKRIAYPQMAKQELNHLPSQPSESPRGPHVPEHALLFGRWDCGD